MAIVGVIIHVCEAEENIEGTAKKESYIKSSDGNTINIDFIIRQTQHWNTVGSFIYFLQHLSADLLCHH